MAIDKNTALDYFLEFIRCEEKDVWVRNVIITYLNKHMQLTDEDKNLSLINC